MLTRRTIRVKVMQTLYSLEAMNNGQLSEGVSILKKNLEQPKQLFTFLVYFITEVSLFAEADALQKSNKHLPTTGDLNINTKISGNELVWSVLGNGSFRKTIKASNTEHLADRELVKKIYTSLIESEEYHSYISTPERDKKSEKKIIEFIFSQLLLPNENFISSLEENFVNWDDDADMMITLMANFLQKPSTFNFEAMVTQEKWEFAKNLLECVNNKKEYCLDLIKPKLKNWDADRIAALDMILMQMGVCEFLYFETIPPKVTINEYIDVAKDYSTPQSGHFVNGILDSIHKDLLTQNKIHKKNFKNSTL